MSTTSPFPGADDSYPVLQAPGPIAIDDSPQHFSPAPGQSQKSQNSYFTTPGSEAPADSPTRAASGSRSSAELLRRLSLVDPDRPATPYLDPQVEYPALNLTGRIISATFCIPHTLGFRSGRDWVCVFSALGSVFH